MARDIDEKKKRKALRKLRKAAERADAENGPGLSEWEREFVEDVEMRVEKYGSAFGDPEKGNLDEPLSALQTRKLKEIDKKSRGKKSSFKTRSGFSNSRKKKQAFKPRSRDIHEDVEPPGIEPAAQPPATPVQSGPAKLKLVRPEPSRKAPPTSDTKPALEQTDTDTSKRRSTFQIIEGGKKS